MTSRATVWGHMQNTICPLAWGERLLRKRVMGLNEIIGAFQSRPVGQLLLLAGRNLRDKSCVLMRAGRQHKWIWAMLVALVSIRSYFVRELLSALLLFAILFVILASLVGLSVLMGHILYCSMVRAEAVARSFQCFVQHSLGLPVRVAKLGKSADKWNWEARLG